MSQKHAATERFGGPGASREDAKDGSVSHHSHAETGQNKTADGKRNPANSEVSGGGGKRDSHHTHDPATKS